MVWPRDGLENEKPIMFFGAAGLEQPRCELPWWELAISKLGWYSSLRCWDPRGLGYPVKPSCVQCCTKCQDRMKQNKQSRPRNPKKGDGLAFQVRRPWVFGQIVGQARGGLGGAVGAVFSVFSRWPGLDLSDPRLSGQGRMWWAFCSGEGVGVCITC